MTDTSLLAVFLAAIAGLLAGRAWAAALRRRQEQGRPLFRTSVHYTEGLHHLASGQLELAISDLGKVARDHPQAVEVLVVLSDLLREAGQVERAIQMHQKLLERDDLTRAERAQALASLGTDFRKAGFLDRAARTYEDALRVDTGNIHALVGQQKLDEEQRQWRAAYETRTRLSRLRKTEEGLVLGYLQAEMGVEAARAGRREEADQAFRTALALDRRVFPAHLGLADLHLATDPTRAAAILEEAAQTAPERAYLGFDRLERAYAAIGEPSRFVDFCERIIRKDRQDWRARLALARHLRRERRHEEALGLLLRAVEANPQVLLAHLEVWRTLREMGGTSEAEERYIQVAEASVFYADPHICTACRYRAGDMLWRCPHCHEWSTFVEERLAPASAGR